MRNKIMLALLLVACAAVIIGCATQNPAWVKPQAGQPDTNTVPKYVVDPRLGTTSNSIMAGIDATAPVNPYAGIVRPFAEAVLTVFGVASAYVARQKSKSLDVMGAGVVKSGSAQVVLDHASNTSHFVAVADAINNATGVTQNNVGAPKSS